MAGAPGWFTRLLRALFVALVRLFYPRRRVEGVAHLPAEGPVILVANHPNGLLDPVVLELAVGRPVQFLAKSTFFRNPAGRLTMAAFGSIPIYRPQDRPGPGARARNEETFALCRASLRAGGWLALFPEGTSHSDPQMRPLKTGAARIALSAVGQEGGAGETRPLTVTILPAGLSYEAKSTFRSGVLVRFGAPIVVAARAGVDEWSGSEALTARIRAGLADVVLEAETRDLLDGVARVAGWTAPEAAPGRGDPAVRHHRTRTLLEAYQAQRERNPEAVERITRAVRDYARVLRHLGVRDPWGLELGEVNPGRVLRAAGKLALAAPLAVLGALLAWLPYRLAGRVAVRVAGSEVDILSTVKLVAGSIFILATWLFEAIVVGLLVRPLFGLLLLVAAPVAGYAALRFEELLGETIVALRHLWLRRAHPRKVARLVDRRRALAAQVADALGGTALPRAEVTPPPEQV